MRQHGVAAKFIFITGVDTSCGKTVFASLLIRHLLHRGYRACALKPFCSGSRRDLQILSAMQEHQLSEDELNFRYFREPLAPWVAARVHNSIYSARELLAWLRRCAAGYQYAVVEGSGGLLTPLGRHFSALQIITRLGAQVVVCGRNKLGVLNHIALTLRVLRMDVVGQPGAVLAPVRRPDLSARSNPEMVRQLVAPGRFLLLPYLGHRVGVERLKKAAGGLGSKLDWLIGFSSGKAGSLDSCLRLEATLKPLITNSLSR